MVTGELKNKVDAVWTAMWSGGISNPIDVIEQLTFLLFLKRLDELHTAEEKKASRLGRQIDRPVFTSKKDQKARWSAFKQLEPNAMYEAIRDVAFPFMKNMGSAGSAYTRHMENAIFKIPTPALLAKVVDMLDAIPMEDRDTKRRQALATLDTLLQSVFLDMFGDPVTNPKGWPTMELGQSAVVFSDGPFGSNLKSDHYVPEGVRVVRLQNIGVGEFVDEDRAFITDKHFRSLGKHRCLPGDVLVGTLGDPNLRACVQPEWLSEALNKADCVQIRPDARVATNQYLCWLCNMPGTLNMAQSLILGQTRLRISMGRLRSLRVPMPPVARQQRFSRVVHSVEARQREMFRASKAADALFATLQSAAFAGTLFTDRVDSHTESRELGV